MTYYRWRKEYGGLKGDQVKRLKELEAENTRLRRAVSDLTLDKLILQRLPGETSKPRASPGLRGSCPSSWGLRAPGLCGSGPASIDAAQGPAGRVMMTRL